MDERDSIQEAGRLLALNFVVVEHLAGGRAIQMVSPHLADCFGAARMGPRGDLAAARTAMERALDTYSQFMQMAVLQQRVQIRGVGYDVQPLLRDARLRVGAALRHQPDETAPARLRHARFYAEIAGCLLQFDFRSPRSRDLGTEESADDMLVLALRYSTDRWDRDPESDHIAEAHASLRAHLDFPTPTREDQLLREVLDVTLTALTKRLTTLN